MKKRLVSFLLLLVLLISLLPSSAFAVPAVTIVQLSLGESVAMLCSRYGIDYNTYRPLIMALNCVSNEAEFANFPVGTQVAIPVSAAAAAALSAAQGAGTSPAPGTGSTGNVSGAGSTNNAPGVASKYIPGDTIACYVISYTFQAGDTISNLYKSRGMSYKTFSSAILQLNKLSGFNNIRAGKTLLLPVTVVQQNDQVVYTLMRHVMKSGETVYSVISSGYGMNFKANQDMLKMANGKEDLGKFKVGEALLIPIQGYISPSAIQAA